MPAKMRFCDSGVSPEFVQEQLSFTGDGNAMANLLLNVGGTFAEFERSLIRERQREGIALATKRVALMTARCRTALLSSALLFLISRVQKGRRPRPRVGVSPNRPDSTRSREL